MRVRRWSEGLAKKRIELWKVTNARWQRGKPLISSRAPSLEKKYLRRPGAGRPPKPVRRALEAVIYVLRTGCQCRALLKVRLGSASTIHKQFPEWRRGEFVQGALGIRRCRPKSDGLEQKREANANSGLPGVASPCCISSPWLTSMTVSDSMRFSVPPWSSFGVPRIVEVSIGALSAFESSTSTPPCVMGAIVGRSPPSSGAIRTKGLGAGWLKFVIAGSTTFANRSSATKSLNAVSSP